MMFYLPCLPRSSKQRQIIACFAAACLTAGAFGIWVAAHYQFHLGSLSGMVAGVIGIVWFAALALKVSSELLHALLYVTLSMTCLCIAMADVFFSGTYLMSTWPLFVVVVDLTLVLRLKRGYSLAVVVCVVLWLAVSGAEKVWRFGLYDVPLSRPAADRLEIFMDRSDCTTLPCGVEVVDAMVATLLGVFVFLIDFIATRGFAEEVAREQGRMQHTIATVQHIATLLASYDVDMVSEILTRTKSDLPSSMHTALAVLEQNIRAHRPYLPTALIERLYGVESVATNSLLSRSEVCRVGTTPPGMETAEAAIVFTDVRCSTSIWEDSPDAMRKAIRVHNTQIRAAIAEHNGYEVKTIGDAFMVAFESISQAVDFSLATHLHLVNADWPPELSQVPICKPINDASGKPLWGGLTVRIGVNSGPVSLEENVLTRRIDYFGPTVNIAARLEGRCLPGAVALPAELWDTLHDTANAVSTPSEPATLKGVKDPLLLCFLWPNSLCSRSRTPLADAAVALSDTSSLSKVWTEVSFATSPPPTRLVAASATIGTVQLRVPKQGTSEADVGNTLGHSLEHVVLLLHKSGGMPNTLVGQRMVVGWNLQRESLAHAESALMFAHHLRVSLGEDLEGIGLATGSVLCGDVGGVHNRFMTVLGDPLSVSWGLCLISYRDEKTCLYAAPEVNEAADSSGGVARCGLPAALRCFVRHSGLVWEGGALLVYELMDELEIEAGEGDRET